MQETHEIDESCLPTFRLKSKGNKTLKIKETPLYIYKELKEDQFYNRKKLAQIRRRKK